MQMIAETNMGQNILISSNAFVHLNSLNTLMPSFVPDLHNVRYLSLQNFETSFLICIDRAFL